MNRFLNMLFFILLTTTAVQAKNKTDETVQSEKQKNETDFITAETLLYRRQTQKALPELVRLCEKEYLRACSLLGFAYYSGRYGVPQDTETGIDWYKKCAEKEKNFFCRKELGRIYYRMGDYDNALHNYNAAAQSNDADAQYWLGRLYLDGKGAHANYEQALKWMRRAAHARKNPSKNAKCALVEMSYFGIGMRKSMKDTKYWMVFCDNPFIRALMSFYGHGVPKDKERAKEIMTAADLKEALADWDDLNGQSRPTVGKKSIRDQLISEDCLKNSKKRPAKIATYAVKIFNPDFYRSFDVHDGYIEKSGIGDQTFEACGTTFYTTIENKRLFLKSLKNKDVIKISRYKNACLVTEITEICDLNLNWQEEKKEDEE